MSWFQRQPLSLFVIAVWTSTWTKSNKNMIPGSLWFIQWLIPIGFQCELCWVRDDGWLCHKIKISHIDLFVINCWTKKGFSRFLTKELLWQTSPLSTWAHIVFLLNYSNIDSQFPFIRHFLSVISIFHNPGFLITMALFDIKENGEICRMVDIVNKDRCNNGKYFSSLV